MADFNIRGSVYCPLKREKSLAPKY